MAITQAARESILLLGLWAEQNEEFCCCIAYIPLYTATVLCDVQVIDPQRVAELVVGYCVAGKRFCDEVGKSPSAVALYSSKGNFLPLIKTSSSSTYCRLACQLSTSLLQTVQKQPYILLSSISSRYFLYLLFTRRSLIKAIINARLIAQSHSAVTLCQSPLNIKVYLISWRNALYTIYSLYPIVWRVE